VANLFYHFSTLQPEEPEPEPEVIVENESELEDEIKKAMAEIEKLQSELQNSERSMIERVRFYKRL
jgi:hypothetical protein